MALSLKRTTLIQTVHLALFVSGLKQMRGRVHGGDKGKEQGWSGPGLGQYWVQ